MLLNTKSKKIIVGFFNNGNVDEIVKYFKRREEGKLIVVRNGKKIKEIENEQKIENYLNNKNNFGKKSQYWKNKEFQKYFFMKREELEKLLSDKIDIDDINSINERLRKKDNEENIDNIIK